MHQQVDRAVSGSLVASDVFRQCLGKFLMHSSNNARADTKGKGVTKRGWLRLPVVSESAECLVMGYLMRRNVLTYKAPPNNEGYDLICIHPDPRHQPSNGEVAQVRVQVKSRYATDCDRGFPVKEASLNAFDFLVVVFLNIGNFYNGRDGAEGGREPEFFTLSNEFIRTHHQPSKTWSKVRLKSLSAEIEPFKGDLGFELIAERLGVTRPRKHRDV